MASSPRTTGGASSRFLLRPGVLVDLKRARVEPDEGPHVSLTGKEVDLLAFLAATPGEDVDFETLHREVWGHGPEVMSRAAQNTVHRLRRKLEVDPKQPAHLLTARGAGVRLVVAREVAATVVEAPLGRDDLLQTVRAALAPGVVVTLSGLGGIGKTTVARAVLQYEGGLWVPLVAASTTEGVTSALAGALGVPDVDEEQVGRALAGAGVALVVLDNAEQVLDAVRRHLTAWRDAAPEVAWLVTSRMRLSVQGEVVLSIPPLALPDAGDDGLRSPAVQLYFASAAPHVSLDEAPAVAALVRDLDGVPLAIELAAARAELLGPAALRERLDRGLQLLKRRGDGRQDAMTATLEWSWSLLSTSARRALARCSSFRTPFRVEAAEALLDDLDAFALDLLQELVDASLLTRAGDRLAMPSLVKAFARSQLDEPEGVVAEAYEAVFARLGGPGVELFPWALDARGEARTRAMDQELEDVEAAARGAVEAARPHALPLVCALVAIRGRCGPPLSPSDLVERLLAASEVPVDGRRRLALLWAASLARAEAAPRAMELLGPPSAMPDLHEVVLRQVAAYALGDNDAVSRAFEAGLGCTEGPAVLRATHLAIGGYLAIRQGDLPAADARLEQALVLAPEGSHAVSMALAGLAAVAARSGRRDDEWALQQRAVEAAEGGGDPIRLANLLASLGAACSSQGDFEGAEAALARAAETYRRVGVDAPTLGIHRAELALEQGRWADAELRARQAAARSLRGGQPRLAALARSAEGRAMACAGRLDEAAALLASVQPDLDSAPRARGRVQVWRAVIAARRGVIPEARVLFEGAPPPRSEDEALWGWAEAEIARAEGDTDRVEALWAQHRGHAATSDHLVRRLWSGVRSEAS